MKSIFLDTNVLIDFLADRKPFAEAAAQLFNSSLKGKLRIFISAVAYNNIYYIMRQQCSHSEAIKMLNALAEMTIMIDVSRAIINDALQSEFKDFEDAIQYYCALSVSKVDMIVTRDGKDFKKSKLPVMNPNEAIGLLRS